MEVTQSYLEFNLNKAIQNNQAIINELNHRIILEIFKKNFEYQESNYEVQPLKSHEMEKTFQIIFR